MRPEYSLPGGCPDGLRSRTIRSHARLAEHGLIGLAGSRAVTDLCVARLERAGGVPRRRGAPGRARTKTASPILTVTCGAFSKWS